MKLFQFIKLLNSWVLLVFLVTSCKNSEESEFVSIVNTPNKVVSKLSYNINIAFQANEKREIVVELWKQDEIIGSVAKIVNKGSDVLGLKLSMLKYPEEGNDYLYKTYMRPLGDGWKELVAINEKKNISILGGSYFENLPKSSYLALSKVTQDPDYKDFFYFEFEYEAEEDSEISVVLNHEGKINGQKVKKVEAGKGVKKIKVKLKEHLSVNSQMLAQTHIRPVGSSWKEARFKTDFKIYNSLEKGIYTKSNLHDKKVPKNDYIDISKNISDFKISKNSVELIVSYGTTENRSIQVSIKSLDGEWIGGNKVEVRKGTGQTFLIINLTEQEELLPLYKVSVISSPIGEGWKNKVASDDLTLIKRDDEYIVKGNTHSIKVPKKEYVQLSKKTKDIQILDGNIELLVAYGTKENRKIQLNIKDENGNWIGGSKFKVLKGSGKIYANIKLKNTSKNFSLLKVNTIVMPIGGNWKDKIVSDQMKLKKKGENYILKPDIYNNKSRK